MPADTHLAVRRGARRVAPRRRAPWVVPPGAAPPRPPRVLGLLHVHTGPLDGVVRRLAVRVPSQRNDPDPVLADDCLSTVDPPRRRRGASGCTGRHVVPHRCKGTARGGHTRKRTCAAPHRTIRQHRWLQKKNPSAHRGGSPPPSAWERCCVLVSCSRVRPRSHWRCPGRASILVYNIVSNANARANGVFDHHTHCRHGGSIFFSYDSGCVGQPLWLSKHERPDTGGV